MDIVEKFKQYMLDNGITYEEAAKRIGWTRQNLWYKLNVGVSPTYGTIKKFWTPSNIFMTTKNWLPLFVMLAFPQLKQEF